MGKCLEQELTGTFGIEWYGPKVLREFQMISVMAFKEKVKWGNLTGFASQRFGHAKQIICFLLPQGFACNCLR